ncbi:DUF58 domain-containing protein [Actinotalea sp. BY-33]|uniref:DUF58 domain-containing protein n=1 Tax=Actinotalea soli TaxID=2819234 RepID=A0A939LSW2_9CELL|nr:DUF58 domain-containing protein [Actinotalea soli]MBO1753273.1 DUF58 domain-containing protein [Actinotalea soli]
MAPRVRPTGRGLALALAGLAFLVAGVLVGALEVVQIGALLLLAVVAGGLQLVVEHRAQRRGQLRLTRRVVPHPVVAGAQASVDVELTSSGGSHRLDRLEIAERAARELSGAGGLRARVQRAPGRLTLTYAISPERRGRWAVGPLEVRRRDLFGTTHSRGPLGEPMLVGVRPRVAPLSLQEASSSQDVDRAALGAKTASPDDSSLREYRAGDDLRRVHWRSSARRGTLVVRQDERSGRRPASVLLDIATEDEAAEWSISAAASMALALLDGGHHTRILGGDVLGAANDHHRADTGPVAAEALLDQTVDLRRPRDEDERRGWLVTAVDTLTVEAGGAELVFAVLGGTDRACLTSLARVGEASHGWAMVRTAAEPLPDEVETLTSLRRAGWTACPVTVGEDLGRAWARLLSSDDRLAVRR